MARIVEKEASGGLFKYTRLDRIFNTDLVKAYNVLITPSPRRSRVKGLKISPE